MLQSLRQVESGVVPPKVFQKAVITSRVLHLDLSPRSIIRACHTSGLTILDVDKVEDRYLLSGTKNGDLAIHDLVNRSGHPSYTAKAICKIRRGGSTTHKFCIQSAQWYPFDTGMFVTSSMDRTVKIWDANFLKPAESISVDFNISGHHMSPLSTHHSLIAVGMMCPYLILLDLRTGSYTHQIQAHSYGVTSVRWSPQSEYLLASGGNDNRIHFWDIRSANKCLRNLDVENRETYGSKKEKATAHNARVTNLRFTDDGLFLVSIGADKCIHLWDVALCKNTLVNYGNLPSVNPNFKVSIDMCCDSDRPLLFVPCRNFIIVYDLFLGYTHKWLTGHLNSVTTCVFRSTTQQIYSGGYDMNILLWTPDVDRELEEEAPNCPCTLSDDVSISVDSDHWSGDES